MLKYFALIAWRHDFAVPSRMDTLRPQSSSFLGLPYRILDMNPKKELLWGLRIVVQ